MPTIAIVGSGPTAIYSAACLLKRGTCDITMFEAQPEAGKGMPYSEDWNDKTMLANIASIEIPSLNETLLAWVSRQPDHWFDHYAIDRAQMDERSFFPRIVLGEYFQAQLQKLIAYAEEQGSSFTIRTSSPVQDVMLERATIRVAYEHHGHERYGRFDRVILATGHSWPEAPEVRPGYFLSPWPASALQRIGQCHVCIRGTSLSAIDTAVALAVARGSFQTDENGTLNYLPEPGTEPFRITMISRKGLLPEADFYHPIPYEPLTFCTEEALTRLIKTHPDTLLDGTYDLFKAELAASAPEYAESIGLEHLTLEEFSAAYFAPREAVDPFTWAEQNLAEAIRNQARAYTVPWRYAILRMHEVVALIAPHLDAEQSKRFNQYFKPIFVDDYATVPHTSIERLLALHRAGKLEILAVGEEYSLDNKYAEGGALLRYDDKEIHFPAFIEALGQRPLSVKEFPFPSLRQQGVVRNAEMGGIALDATYHPVSDLPQARNLYCLSVPFLLGQFPFAQGITSSYEMGRKVAEEIIGEQNTDIELPGDILSPVLCAHATEILAEAS